MASRKRLIQSPGRDRRRIGEAELEIEIVNPDMVTLDDGSMEITIIPDADESDLVPFDGNLAEALR